MANTLPAGALRHRIRFEALIVDVDSHGATVEDWIDPFGRLISAEIAPLSGRELIAAQGLHSKVNARIRIRARSGIVASMRAIHRDTVYNVEAVIPDTVSGQRWLTLMCSSGVNEG